jgi:hypothetical protein
MVATQAAVRVPRTAALAGEVDHSSDMIATGQQVQPPTRALLALKLRVVGNVGAAQGSVHEGT